MPTYHLVCDMCGKSAHEFWTISEYHTFKKVGQSCECGGKFVIKIGLPAVHAYYSPMHPRYRRGMKARKG